MLRAIAFTGAILVAANAAAQDGASCAPIENDAKRLLCYDLTFRERVEASAVEGKGRWQVATETSRIDDSANVFLLLYSSNNHENRYGKAEPLTLRIACREDKTSVTIEFAGEFMSSVNGRGVVTYRVDDHPAQRKRFTESTDNMHLGLWGGGQAIPFIKELLGGRDLFVRAIPFSENAVDGDFAIEGLDHAIRPLRDACHW